MVLSLDLMLLPRPEASSIRNFLTSASGSTVEEEILGRNSFLIPLLLPVLIVTPT